MADPAKSIEAYARLVAALSAAGERRAEVLAAQGLDEDSWEALDEHWQSRIDAAEREHGEKDGLAPLMLAYSEAFVKAQRQRDAEPPLDFDTYVALTKKLRAGREVALVLEAAGVPLARYLAAHQAWTQAMVRDDALAERFAAAMR